MPNDAKLGLFFGMGLVIVVAVLFFHKDLPGVNLAAGNSPAWGQLDPVDGKTPPTPLAAAAMSSRKATRSLASPKSIMATMSVSRPSTTSTATSSTPPIA